MRGGGGTRTCNALVMSDRSNRCPVFAEITGSSGVVPEIEQNILAAARGERTAAGPKAPFWFTHGRSWRWRTPRWSPLERSRLVYGGNSRAGGRGPRVLDSGAL